MPFEALALTGLTAMSCHVRLLCLAYSCSTRRYGPVGANEARFGVITKELLMFEVGDILVI